MSGGHKTGPMFAKNFKTGATTFASYVQTTQHRRCTRQKCITIEKKDVKMVATKQTRWCLNNICTARFKAENIATT